MTLTVPQQLWVDALRSGEYEQGTGCLSPNGDSFCCLGVACEVAIKAGVINDYAAADDNLAGAPGVTEWLGLSTPSGCFDLSTPSGCFDEREEMCDLMSANDYAKWSFEKIADFIESEPAGLFVNG